MKISKLYSLLSLPTTEEMAKYFFLIATNAVSEIISVSGRLNKRGICEAIIFNTNIILNNTALKQKSYYKAVSDEYLFMLYLLVQQQRTDLSQEELINFINKRMEFYSSQYNKLLDKEKQYAPILVYSNFYLTPLENKPKMCLDVLQVMTFQVGLIRMVCKVYELLDKQINQY